MKKIGILTWYADTMNYGSVLQAYAMQCFLKDNGYEPSFINYKSTTNDIVYPPKIYLIGEKVYNKLRRIVFMKARYDLSATKKYCTNFVSENINSTRKYIGSKELHHLCNQFDGFICGSDQIWSLNKKHNPVYFLDWVDDDKIKVAYAPSIPLNYASSKRRKFLQKVIHGYNGISVREEKSATQLSEILGTNVTSVLDPTLLVEKQTWTRLVNPVEENPYIICYFLGEQPYYREVVEKYKNEFGCKVYVIPTEEGKNDKYGEMLEKIGPIEFLSFISSAELVITDSYHASIFSVIFEKKLIILERFKEKSRKSQNSRIYDLTTKLGIENSIVRKKDASRSISSIEYSELSCKLEILRKQSVNFILNALNSQEERSK